MIRATKLDNISYSSIKEIHSSDNFFIGALITFEWDTPSLPALSYGPNADNYRCLRWAQELDINWYDFWLISSDNKLMDSQKGITFDD